ncbi:DNA-binding protein [Bacteroides uniformis]|uniref:HU family DNA-binding protein n=1 Tax=Bacteroides uniformis TaxID=820 RepID=UPI0039844F61
MIRYKKYQMTGENSPLKGLWYARPVLEETYDTERLAKHMANHNTPYSAGVVKGVLTDMISCIKELILDGKNVKLDDLAIFSVGIVSRKGAASAADFTLADNVKGLKLRARATGELSNAQINLEGQMKEAAVYNPDGGTTEGGGGNPGGGSDGDQGENPLG